MRVGPEAALRLLKRVLVYVLALRPLVPSLTRAFPRPLLIAHLSLSRSGCFWCVEAPISELKGVRSAQSGYIGGAPSAQPPTYREVCGGDTGHAEAVRVVFDPKVLPFKALLDVFFTLHDPTQLNRQGNDSGTQYRSAIFYHSPAQLATAKEVIAHLESSKQVKRPVVTELSPADKHTWYPAEQYHQNYVNNNPGQGYVRAVSLPKREKVRHAFPDLLDPAAVAKAGDP